MIGGLLSPGGVLCAFLGQMIRQEGIVINAAFLSSRSRNLAKFCLAWALYVWIFSNP